MDIRERFQSVEFDEDQADISSTLSDAFADLAETVEDLLPDSREKSLVLTNIEQASMWSNACLARNPMD